MIPLVRLRVVFLSEGDEENKKHVARITEQEACVYGCVCGRGANCKVLEGIKSWCFLIVEDKEEELCLNKVQTNKKAYRLCYEQRAESRTCPVSFYCHYCKIRVT